MRETQRGVRRMSTEVIVALLALAGTLAGSFGGILVSNKLVNFRLSQLENKVDRHNRVIERIVVAENDIKTIKRFLDLDAAE